MDKSKELPHGFFDYVGEPAEKMLMVINEFHRTGNLYGFDWMDLSHVGYEETYLEFGSAARDRGYCFTDSGGRKLMLCADSLAASLRAYRKQVEASRGQTARLMGRVEVFRHRKKKYRNWSHLVFSMFNEKNIASANTVLVTFANDFLLRYYPEIRYTFFFYDIYEKVFEHFGISIDEGFNALYEMYELGRRNTDLSSHQLINRIETICVSQEGIYQTLVALEVEFPFLKCTVDEINDYLKILSLLRLDYTVSWTNFRAIEYSSGICFIVTDLTTGGRIADGGAYHRVVNQIDPTILNCFSFACLLEDIALNKMVKPEMNPVFYIIKLDCSSYFFALASASLRKRGIPVIETAADKKLSRVIASLPAKSKYSVIGQMEEQNGRIEIDGQVFEV